MPNSLVGGGLVGLRELLESALGGKLLQARQPRAGIRNPGDVDQYKSGRAVAVLAPRGSGELVAQPADGGAHQARIAAFAFDAQIAVPAGTHLEALDQRAHEREVADVQLAPTCRPDKRERWRAHRSADRARALPTDPLRLVRAVRVRNDRRSPLVLFP